MEDRIEEVVSRLNSHQSVDTEDDRLDRFWFIEETSCELVEIYRERTVEREEISWVLDSICPMKVAAVLALLVSCIPCDVLMAGE